MFVILVLCMRHYCSAVGGCRSERLRVEDGADRVEVYYSMKENEWKSLICDEVVMCEGCGLEAEDGMRFCFLALPPRMVFF